MSIKHGGIENSNITFEGIQQFASPNCRKCKWTTNFPGPFKGKGDCNNMRLQITDSTKSVFVAESDRCRMKKEFTPLVVFMKCNSCANFNWHEIYKNVVADPINAKYCGCSSYPCGPFNGFHDFISARGPINNEQYREEIKPVVKPRKDIEQTIAEEIKHWKKPYVASPRKINPIIKPTNPIANIVKDFNKRIAHKDMIIDELRTELNVTRIESMRVQEKLNRELGQATQAVIAKNSEIENLYKEIAEQDSRLKKITEDTDRVQELVKEVEQRTTTIENVYTCPGCHKIIESPAETTYCPNCGVKVAEKTYMKHVFPVELKAMQSAKYEPPKTYWHRRITVESGGMLALSIVGMVISGFLMALISWFALFKSLSIFGDFVIAVAVTLVAFTLLLSFGGIKRAGVEIRGENTTVPNRFEAWLESRKLSDKLKIKALENKMECLENKLDESNKKLEKSVSFDRSLESKYYNVDSSIRAETKREYGGTTKNNKLVTVYTTRFNVLIKSENQPIDPDKIVLFLNTELPKDCIIKQTEAATDETKE